MYGISFRGVIVTLERALKELASRITNINIAEQNVPVGIGISSNGNFILEYSLSTGELYESIEDVRDALQDFFDKS